MSPNQVFSRNGIPIRLPDERWQHIIDEHAERVGLREEALATVRDAERVLRGNAGELLAVRTLEPGKAMVVVYREVGIGDGFIITAFVTRRLPDSCPGRRFGLSAAGELFRAGSRFPRPRLTGLSG